MSYDIRISVKVADAKDKDGNDIYAVIARPEHDSPTYNLRDMFVNCMDWDYEQSEYYKCSEIIDKINHGIKELRTKRNKYIKYNSPNGWGTIDNAINALESSRDCIYEQAEYIPIDCLYFNW